MITVRKAENNFAVSDEFHQKYYDDMYDKNVCVTLKNGRQIIGLYNDEFYEDASVLVNCEVVKIKDIDKIMLQSCAGQKRQQNATDQAAHAYLK